MREVFFCAEEDNSQYIGLWLELDSLNSILLKAADVCLDPNYRPFTIPFFTSWLLITSDRRLLIFH